MLGSASADHQTVHEKRRRARRLRPETTEGAEVRGEVAAVATRWTGRLSETTCSEICTHSDQVVWFGQHPVSLPTPLEIQNGFHLYRLAALAGRKTISLQLRIFFFLCRIMIWAHLHSPSSPQAPTFGVQYVRIPNQANSTESLTTEGFLGRWLTGVCLLLRWQT